MSLSILIGSSIFCGLRSLLIEVVENFAEEKFSFTSFDVDKSSGSRTSDWLESTPDDSLSYSCDEHVDSRFAAKKVFKLMLKPDFILVDTANLRVST